MISTPLIPTPYSVCQTKICEAIADGIISTLWSALVYYNHNLEEMQAMVKSDNYQPIFDNYVMSFCEDCYNAATEDDKKMIRELVSKMIP